MAARLEEVDETQGREFMEEFGQVSDEWKPSVIEQMAQFRRLAELRLARMDGGEEREADAAETANQAA